jgi:uncharacterized membrane-anchored protein
VRAGPWAWRTAILLLQFTPRKGSYTVATDAWFFPEGQGKKFEAARFGVFKLNASGQALMVGMAEEDGRLIR